MTLKLLLAKVVYYTCYAVVLLFLLGGLILLLITNLDGWREVLMGAGCILVIGGFLAAWAWADDVIRKE
jgi:hypothetical protein